MTSIKLLPRVSPFQPPRPLPAAAYLKPRDFGHVQREGRLRVRRWGEEPLSLSLLLMWLLIKVPICPEAVGEEEGVDVGHEETAG